MRESIWCKQRVEWQLNQFYELVGCEYALSLALFVSLRNETKIKCLLKDNHSCHNKILTESVEAAATTTLTTSTQQRRQQQQRVEAHCRAAHKG